MEVQDYSHLICIFFSPCNYSIICENVTYPVHFTKYFKFELYAKNDIAKADLPLFLTTWLDKSSLDCMFSTWQMRNWMTPHLQACSWYLKCNIRDTPPTKEMLFMTLAETTVVEPEFDEFHALDIEARTKAIAKRDASNKKKVERLEDAKKRTTKNKVKRLASKTEKAKKKGMKRKPESLLLELANSVAEVREESSGFSLTQDRLVDGLTPTIMNIAHP